MTLPLRVLACLALLPLHGALAQVDLSGSVALQSEYRYRGQSPGDSGPVPQLTLNLDSAGGWYAGGFASAMAIGDLTGYKLQGYAGFAQRLRTGGSWELGCSHTAYTRLHMNDFHECYGGLSGERISGRLYYAPRYLGYAAKTLYAEVNLFYPLHPAVNLIAHAGLLHNLSKGVWPGIPAASRYDARLGISVPLGDWTLQLAREQGQDDGMRYHTYPLHSAKTWSMAASYGF